MPPPRVIVDAISVRDVRSYSQLELSLEPGLFDGTLLRRGGTILGTTNKGDPFDYPLPDGRRVDRSEEVIEGYRRLKLDALIGIGGDGSQAILRRLAQQAAKPVEKPREVNLLGVRALFETAAQALKRPKIWIAAGALGRLRLSGTREQPQQRNAGARDQMDVP